MVKPNLIKRIDKQIAGEEKPKKKKEKLKPKYYDLVWNDEEIIKESSFVCDSDNLIFHFGFLNPKWMDDIVKDKIIGKKQIKTPIIITSNKKAIEVNYFNNQKYKLNFSLIPSYLPHRWRLEYQKRWLDNKIEFADGKELLNKIESQYKKYLQIRNETWYKIHAIWDIGTYFYELFEAYPFLELRGITGTGKTKSMVVSSYMSFNGGQIMVNPSESTLFREKEEVRGTSYFDEAEKLWIYNKSTKQYEGDNRTELINASYTKEAKVPRQEKVGNKYVTKWYRPYSPIQLSSINGLYGATETRAITRITTKSPNDDERGELDPSEDRKNPIWEEIRDLNYRFALENWNKIRKSYNNFDKKIGLKRRDYQIWKPLLVIAKFINEEIYKEILEFAIEITERKTGDLILESSFDYMCLEALRDTIEKFGSETNKIYVEMIKNQFCLNKKSSEEKDNIYLNRNISKHLDQLGFKECRKRDNKASYFEVDKNIFNEIVSPICPNLVFLSTLSTLSTQQHTKQEKKSVDNVAISGDKKNKKVVMVAISGDNVDNIESGDKKITPENAKELNQIMEDFSE